MNSEVDQTTGLPVQGKRRRSTGPRQQQNRPTAAFFIVQILDENGNSVPFDRSRLRVVSIERSAEKVLELVEGDNNDNSFYLRVMVPAARRGAPSHS